MILRSLRKVQQLCPALRGKALGYAVESFEHEVVLQFEGNRQSWAERAGRAAGKQADQARLLRGVQMVEALDCARLRVLAAARDRVHGLRRRLHVFAVRV